MTRPPPTSPLFPSPPLSRPHPAPSQPRVENLADPLAQLREERAARHRRDDRRRQAPAELLGDLVRDGLRPLAVVAPQIDVHDPPAEPIRDLGAQPVHVVVRPAHAYEAGAVDAGADDLAGLELVGDE